MGDSIHEIVLGVFNALLFVSLVTVFIIFASRYEKNNILIKENGYNKEAVSSFPEELTDEVKDLITGSYVLDEVLSFPESTYIKINGTVITDLSTVTGDDYITYAKKYGTDKLETYISLLSTYKRELALDSDGNVVGVTYTIVY